MLGAVTAPMKGVRTAPLRPPRPKVTLVPHPVEPDTDTMPCGACGRPNALPYHHPNPLRPGVVLWRCALHRYPSSVRDDPRAAPGGGVYR